VAPSRPCWSSNRPSRLKEKGGTKPGNEVVIERLALLGKNKGGGSIGVQTNLTWDFGTGVYRSKQHSCPPLDQTEILIIPSVRTIFCPFRAGLFMSEPFSPTPVSASELFAIPADQTSFIFLGPDLPRRCHFPRPRPRADFLTTRPQSQEQPTSCRRLSTTLRHSGLRYE